MAECRSGDHAASFQPQLTAPTRLLLDLTGIASVDGWEAYLHAVVRSCAEPRHRVALVAPEPLTFGICRQTVLLANVAEGRTVAVFKERGSALSWLAADVSNLAADHGGSGDRPRGWDLR